MTTSLPPTGDKPRFFVMFPTTALFVPEKAYLSFSLPAGKAFPSDLTRLMEKTGRYISFEDSAIEGVEFQRCDGINCACTGCRQQIIACTNESCKGFVSSTDGIQCSNPNCIPTNNIEYSMYPLYPDFLPAYSPKFKFMRYISGGSRGDLTTPAPLSSIEPVRGDYVLFSVVFPSVDVFDTQAKFQELQAAIVSMAPTLKSLDMYNQHNTAMLQKIIKKNRLSRGLLDTRPKNPSPLSLPPRPARVHTTMPPEATRRPRPPATKRPATVERYEDDLTLNELVIPETEQDDTDIAPVELLTPEPGFTTTAPPDNKSNMSTIIIWVAVGMLALLIILLMGQQRSGRRQRY